MINRIFANLKERQCEFNSWWKQWELMEDVVIDQAVDVKYNSNGCFLNYFFIQKYIKIIYIFYYLKFNFDINILKKSKINLK